MSELSVQGLSKRFRGRPPIVAVDDVSLEVSPGEMLVLLGPSGCGKSTILRCLAGLEEPDGGRITFGGRTIFDAGAGVNVPSYRRGLGMVFQAFALWPHLTARKNIAFPLRNQKVPRSEVAALVSEVASMVDLDDELLDKRPGQLSGGQQQRVALARALVGKPQVILFDEPLSNLDALLREQLRAELRRLHQKLGFTGVYVTHDLLEAMALGDRVAVMRKGEVAQEGTPAEVFARPSHGGVAQLLGYRPVCDVERTNAGWHGKGSTVLGLPAVAASAAPASLRAYARPERLRATPTPPSEPGRVVVADGVVEATMDLATRTELAVRVGEHLVRVPIDHLDGSWEMGARVALSAPLDDFHLFDPDGARWTPPSVPAAAPVAEASRS